MLLSRAVECCPQVGAPICCLLLHACAEAGHGLLMEAVGNSTFASVSILVALCMTYTNQGEQLLHMYCISFTVLLAAAHLCRLESDNNPAASSS